MHFVGIWRWLGRSSIMARLLWLVSKASILLLLCERCRCMSVMLGLARPQSGSANESATEVRKSPLSVCLASSHIRRSQLRFPLAKT